MDVRAYDLGEPQLSSVITLDIFIQHVATVAPEVGLRFSDTSYSIQIPENTTVGYLIKILTIVNSQSHGDNIPLKCLIISGNEASKLIKSTKCFLNEFVTEKFLVNVTQDRNCALFLNQSLDFETQENYFIEVKLVSLQGFINKEYSKSEVTINVADVNDNIPQFVFPNNKRLKYYSAVSKGAPLSSTIAQIKVIK